MEVLDVEATTRHTYDGYIRNHIRPLLGDLVVGRLDGEVLDSFYAQLRTCRAHCRGRKYVEHRVRGEHECEARCRPHACRPLASSSIRQIHGILSGAVKRAVRWRWLGSNPIEQAEPPTPGRTEAKPPTAEQAAAIVNPAWTDVDWGIARLAGDGDRRPARRAVRAGVGPARLTSGVLTIRSSIAQTGAKTWEKHTKTHQQRRITLDDGTLALLRAYLRRCVERADARGSSCPLTHGSSRCRRTAARGLDRIRWASGTPGCAPGLGGT
jgi:hypothetical protein